MASRSNSVPAEHELLCEHCGYGLNGLPTVGLCPECGEPVADSTTADGRGLPPWERPKLSGLARLVQTTRGVVFSPRQFFRRMLARAHLGRSRVFAMVQHWLAAYFFSIAIVIHLLFVAGGRWDVVTSVFIGLLGGTALTPFLFAAIAFTTWLVSKLSTLESRYHGFRLPAATVTRALHYHAAHLLPVSMFTAAIVATYRILLATGTLPRGDSELPYLITLCAWVVISAGYLFGTYWLAMRNLVYANR